MAAKRPGRTQAKPRVRAFVLLMLIGFASPVTGQRVQIPTGAADAFSPGATAGAAAPFDPYAAGAPAASSIPYSFAPPRISQPLFNAPTTVQPAQPFIAPAPPQGFAAPATPGGLAPATPLFSAEGATGGSPFEWQPGTYEWQTNDGYYETFTKFLAQLSVDNGYLWGDKDDATDLEVNELEINSTFTYPLGGNLEAPLFITPGFAFNFFSGPIADPTAPMRGPDIPGLLYDAYLDTAWAPHPLPAFGADLGFRIGVYSDFEHVSSDSVRFLGRALGVVNLNPSLDLVLGVVYLDRIDVSLLPAGGVHFRPNDLWDFYAVFPSPRITRRLETASQLQAGWFVAGEYGGGSWTADRAGFDDRFDYNDLRVTTGIEWEAPSGLRGSFEVGYVFDRELVFASGQPGRTPVDDTFILRAGIAL